MSLRALIVDDEPDARENLRIMLEDNCPEVIEFRDRRVAEMGERLVVGHLEDSIKKGTIRPARLAKASSTLHSRAVNSTARRT